MLAETQVAIHDLLKSRWSPRAYEDRPIEDEKLVSLFEAARWSPSAGNVQPWSFIVVKKTDQPTHDQLIAAMKGFNQEWAGRAPVLIAGIAQMEYQPGVASPYAMYDLGQAMAHLTIQAMTLGLSIRQMAGFENDQARQVLHIPDGYHLAVLTAVGYIGDATTLSEELYKRETAPRIRKPLTDFVFGAQWKEPLDELNGQ